MTTFQKTRIVSCIFFSFLFFSQTSFSQPILPQVGILTKEGITVLSWVSPFETGVKSVKIERSADSVVNFQTIGHVNQFKTKSQTFIDDHPLLGNNWYRVVVTFQSEMEWVSNVAYAFVDSAALANQKQLPSGDSLQHLIERMDVAEVIDQLSAVSYPKSRYVFTNPFTGNINIEIDDFRTAEYSVRFFDDKKKKVVEVPEIRDSVLILDKRNFQKAGLFSFVILRNNEEFERGYITIY